MTVNDKRRVPTEERKHQIRHVYLRACDEKISKELDGISNISRFVTDLLRDYFNEELIRIEVKETLKQQFDDISNKHYFLNRLIESYLSNRLISIGQLSIENKEKFNKVLNKEEFIVQLLEQYYNNELISKDDLEKFVQIQGVLNLESGSEINQLNNNIIKERINSFNSASDKDIIVQSDKDIVQSEDILENNYTETTKSFDEALKEVMPAIDKKDFGQINSSDTDSKIQDYSDSEEVSSNIGNLKSKLGNNNVQSKFKKRIGNR